MALGEEAINCGLVESLPDSDMETPIGEMFIPRNDSKGLARIRQRMEWTADVDCVCTRPEDVEELTVDLAQRLQTPA